MRYAYTVRLFNTFECAHVSGYGPTRPAAFRDAMEGAALYFREDENQAAEYPALFARACKVHGAARGKTVGANLTRASATDAGKRYSVEVERRMAD